MYNWNALRGRTLHPSIGIPADATQGLPYLTGIGVSTAQNYGLVAKAYSGTNSISGFLFTSEQRFLLGSGDAINLYGSAGSGQIQTMFAIDGLSNHMFATTSTGIINAPIVINGNKMGWVGGQGPNPLSYVTNPQITFFNYLNANYVGFGNADGGYFGIFKPGGVFNAYVGYAANLVLQPCMYYNGLYTVDYGGGFGGQYGFISLADAPLITPYYLSGNIISYSFTNTALQFSYDSNTTAWYGYDGVNNPALQSSWIKIPIILNSGDVFGFDPVSQRILSISPNIINMNGYNFYPVYVYDSILPRLPTPKLIDPRVKNMTLNGYLNWRR